MFEGTGEYQTQMIILMLRAHAICSKFRSAHLFQIALEITQHLQLCIFSNFRSFLTQETVIALLLVFSII